MKTLAATLALLAVALPCAAQSAKAPPWRFDTPAVTKSAGARVLLMYDMEGLSGVKSSTQFLAGEPDYAEGRKLLAGDVNAVAAGLFAGGASEVWLVDAHGSGNPSSDMQSELLDPRVKWVERNKFFDPYVDISEPGAFDAVAVVGMHAKNGAGGFAAHTITVGVEFALDGRNLTETEIVALSFGQVGTPVIFATGDDKLHDNLAGMPWLKYVEVKRSLDPSTVELRPLDQVHAEMKARAAEALRGLKKAKTMVMTPTRVTVKAVPPADLTVLQGFPGVDYHDNGVSYPASDFHSAYRTSKPVIGVMGASLTRVMMEKIGQEPNAQEIMTKATRHLVQRWFDAEAGKVPAKPEAPTRIERGDH